MTQPVTAIIGAGPAGLTAAHELVRHGRPVTVYEAGGAVGGIARTEQYKGYRFDIGGHRFYTKAPEVQALWESMLGEQFIRVRRLSRIYYQGRFYDYPLKVFNVLGNLGLIEAGRILASYAAARLRPIRDEQSFEDWVTNRFGARLFRTFFKTYTEKVWGIPCSEIRADWAAQRIRELSFASAVLHAVTGRSRTRTLIDSFQYPRLGPGQMWDAFTDAVRSGGGTVQLNSPVTSVRRRGTRITGISVHENGREREAAVDHLISTMPLATLLRCMDPAPPDDVLAAAAGLKYRDFLIVTLIINRPALFPDNWIYIHSPEARVGRIQNFRNWSADMVPDRRHTSVGMEYFCSEGDELWGMDETKLIELARREVQTLGLARSDEVIDACVIRQPKAYPVYDATYRAHLDVIRRYLDTFENLHTVGRNAMHRYNNQDHSMLCGLYAARNVLGARYDLWDVNTDRSYYEEQELPAAGVAAAAGVAGGGAGGDQSPADAPLVEVPAATEALVDAR